MLQWEMTLQRIFTIIIRTENIICYLLAALSLLKKLYCYFKVKVLFGICIHLKISTY